MRNENSKGTVVGIKYCGYQINCKSLTPNNINPGKTGWKRLQFLLKKFKGLNKDRKSNYSMLFVGILFSSKKRIKKWSFDCFSTNTAVSAVS